MSDRRFFLKKMALAGVAGTLIPNVLSAHDIPTTQKGGDKKRALRIAHITDVHLLDQANAERCFARVMNEINSMPDKPDMIINTGDTVMDENKQTRETVETRWKVWNGIVKSNKVPMRSCLGNHDVWYGPDETLDAEYKKDRRYGKQWAIEMLNLPNRYYAFEKNGWKFVALDSINGESGYNLDDTQFDWLKNELASTKPEIPVLIYSHVPILSMGALLYLTKRNPIEEVKFPSGDMHNDHQRIKDLFYQHRNIRVALSGHVHYVDAIEYLGVKYMCNGAVSGNWWRDPLSLDEFAPLYTIVDLYKDGSSESYYVYYDSKA